MSNTLGLAGGQPQAQTRFAPIYTGRWSSGIWTNRSPLRDAATTRLVEKFYGAAGDALIAGSNIEITNRLTLARRPGNPVFDANSYSSVDRFYDFRIFNATSEQIDVMVDQAGALYSLYAGVKSLVWTKQSGAGQSYMQSVGNSLYWGDGASNKKWLQSLTQWTKDTVWNTAGSPFYSTFFIDPNGNIQQLTGTVITVVDVQVTSNVLTITANTPLTDVLSAGCEVTFPNGMAASFLDGTTVTITAVSGSTFTAALGHANYGPTAESNIVANEITGTSTPESGNSVPTWNTVIPSSGNNYQGGLTNDGTAQWTNRGNPVENWGIANGTKPVKPVVGSSRTAWTKNTYYSIAGAIIDSNGNLQQVTTPGISGVGTPSWATVVGNSTTDGSVVWKMIQTAASLVWQPHIQYAAGSFLIGNASGTNCLFQLAPFTQPSISGNVSAYLYNAPHSGPVGQFILTYPTSTGSSLANTTTENSLSFTGADGPTPLAWNIVNGAGETTGSNTPFPAFSSNYQLIILGSFTIPVAGQYNFQINHHDGMIWGIGNGAQLVSGTNSNPIGQTQTANMGYPIFGGTNRGLEGGGIWNDTFTVNFPTAGVYSYEIDYAFWYHSGQVLNVLANSQVIASGAPESGTTEPIWPAWSTSFAPSYPNITESSGQFVWNNIGPVSDFQWQAKVGFTLPDTTIIDPAGYQQAPYESGVTGTTAPTFATGLNQLTADNPNLIWINQGIASAPPVGTVSTFNGGWSYGVALVNTLDNTVSNMTPLSAPTGNFIGAAGVTLAPGDGLPPLNKIDPQADFVAIFRTTDGQSTPFLIPGQFTTYTIPLSDYLVNGYTDTTPDTELNNLISGAINGENTPPAIGAQNLAFHLNRIWYSIGNTVYWTSGSDTPVGNGVNGTSPLNFDSFPSIVKRIVPTAVGAIIFTVSDVYVIQGSGTTSSPIQSGIPIMEGVGLLSYNALDINGSIIGFFTTDRQFCILDPSAGNSYAGFPIGDQFRLDNGTPGQNWNPANVYVTWHVEGEDQGWYVSDGTYGWFRLIPTPAPEQGYTWSPFATIVGGVKAVQSIEVTPGVHKLLLGPLTSGPILNRSLETFQDNGQNYLANGVIGSAVLAQPGQVATVSFITTESVRVGTPLTLGVIFDEALPYYTGPFAILKVWESDPPGLKASKSFYPQRFYLSEGHDEAACRHMQIMVQWAAENQPNELTSLTVFGAYFQEQ